MPQDQTIGEIKVDLDQLERAFEVLEENARIWREGVQILRDAKVPSVTIRGGIAEMTIPIRRPPPPPQEGFPCGGVLPLVNDYIFNLGVIMGAYYRALEGLEGGPRDPDELLT